MSSRAKTGPDKKPVSRGEASESAPVFRDEHGRRVGVLERERKRTAWHEEHGTTDPAKEHAGFLAAQLKGVNLAKK